MANQLSIEEQWANFKATFKREFDEEEEKLRFAIFQGNVKKVEEHNKKYESGETSFKMGINQFSDRKAEEMKMSGGLLR